MKTVRQIRLIREKAKKEKDTSRKNSTPPSRPFKMAVEIYIYMGERGDNAILGYMRQ